METSVKSTDWGWRKNDNSLVPIMTDKDPAPIDLLKFIRCNCKLTTKNPCSSNICTCRKHGLSCMTACGNCHGQNCTNIKVTQPELQSIDSEDDESRMHLIFFLKKCKELFKKYQKVYMYLLYFCIFYHLPRFCSQLENSSFLTLHPLKTFFSIQFPFD